MSWHLKGQYIQACSCKMLCPCLFGPAVPDQGWCSAQLAFDIQEGAADSIPLSGCMVIWLMDLPGDYASGHGTARLYFDERATVEQRRELEAIFTGKRGGPWDLARALVDTWLPSKVAPIAMVVGEDPAVTVGAFGQGKLQRVRDVVGNQTKLVRAPVISAFQVESEDVAYSNGTQWSDPDMRPWQGGGSGGVGTFDWSA
jgi:hypothetical protein